MPQPKNPTLAGRFTDTRWSLVMVARDGEEGDAATALAKLCEAYWQPLYAYLRRAGHAPHDAEDLVQGFLARVVERRIVGEADAVRGKFRSFLIGCLEHYLANEWRREHRVKRGGGEEALPLHDPAVAARVEASLGKADDPRMAFERAWALTVLDRALERVRAECDTFNAARFEVLKPFLTSARGDTPLAEAAQRLGVSLAAMKSMVHRLRDRYRELVRAELRETVLTESDVEEELQHLRNVLAG
jgi:RNA polymerase sigma-70 factor (ECF subfamily)